jgi:hypothetical protein
MPSMLLKELSVVQVRPLIFILVAFKTGLRLANLKSIRVYLKLLKVEIRNFKTRVTKSDQNSKAYFELYGA